MPGAKSGSPVVYETANRELRTRKDYFAQVGKPVIGIGWAEGICVGAEIKPGQIIAQIFWDDEDETNTPIEVPSKCAGRIELINGQIDYNWLHMDSQLLLRLAARKKTKRRKQRRRGRP
jgi:hypothetical protein